MDHLKLTYPSLPLKVLKISKILTLKKFKIFVELLFVKAELIWSNEVL